MAARRALVLCSGDGGALVGLENLPGGPTTCYRKIVRERLQGALFVFGQRPPSYRAVGGDGFRQQAVAESDRLVADGVWEEPEACIYGPNARIRRLD